MRTSAALVASALALGASAKNYLGFNCGTTRQDGSIKVKADFASEFSASQKLIGAPGLFNSFRLYTNIQGGTTNSPVEAFEAAIETKTYLLLGVWASGTDNINNELAALKAAVQKYGDEFAELVIGISIGSEDLYRNGETSMKNGGGIGNSPDAIVGFIKDFKDEFADTPLAKVPVGHVDTWDAWTNGTNKAVIDAIDWLGVDEYPYYQTGDDNTIENSPSLFAKAYKATVGVAGGKEVWVTETGWPYQGPKWDQAVCSIENAKYYWDKVGCDMLFNKVPTFWYTLDDANAANKELFAITKDLSSTALFNLTCPADDDNSSSSSSSSASSTGKSTKSSTATLASPSASHTGSSGSGSSSDSGSGSSSTSSGSGSGSGSGSASASSYGSGSGSGAGSGSNSTRTSTGSASTGTGTGIGGGSGSGFNSTNGSGSGLSPSPTSVPSGAGSLKMASAGALALVAGVVALL